ncbi:hypothetical protein [Thiothrix sp.]|uniref:hypothetical protein n=1 Tax=Thiothrix sp. TaxID=1032 RepID=UPI002579E3DF|nr:hypothetical protein [Thiothrix sp.]
MPVIISACASTETIGELDAAKKTYASYEKAGAVCDVADKSKTKEIEGGCCSGYANILAESLQKSPNATQDEVISFIYALDAALLICAKNEAGTAARMLMRLDSGKSLPMIQYVKQMRVACDDMDYAEAKKQMESGDNGSLLIGAIASGLNSMAETSRLNRQYSSLYVPPQLGSMTPYPAPSIGYVSPYVRRDGTYVSGHYRSAPDGICSNNLGGCR